MSEKKVSESKRQANDRWDKVNVKRMSLVLKVDEWERLKNRIEQTGQPANAFIRAAILEKLNRE